MTAASSRGTRSSGDSASVAAGLARAPANFAAGGRLPVAWSSGQRVAVAQGGRVETDLALAAGVERRDDRRAGVRRCAAGMNLPDDFPQVGAGDVLQAQPVPAGCRVRELGEHLDDVVVFEAGEE